MNVNSNVSVGLLNLYRGQMALNDNRLSRSQFPLPTNNASRSRSYEEGTAQYITNIRSAATSMSYALADLADSDLYNKEADENQVGNNPLNQHMHTYRPEDGSVEPFRPLPTLSINKVRIKDGVTATFNTVAEENELDPRGRKVSVAVESVSRLVSSFNSLRGGAVGGSGAGGSNLETRMMNISSTFAGALSNLGLGVDSQGYMKADSDMLEQAAGDGSLEAFFASESDSPLSFSAQLGRLAGDVMANPSTYVDNSEFSLNRNENHGYSNAGSPIKFNFMRPGTLLDFML